MQYFIQKCANLKPLMTYRIALKRNCTSSVEKLSILNVIQDMPIEEDDHEGDAEECALSKKVNQVRIDVIGSGAHGTSSSVLLRTCSANYLINCGEGTQKLLSEYKMRLTKSPHIFITHPSWKNISGLLGTALTLQDSKFNELNIHGHSCIGNVFSCVNKFANLRNLFVKVVNCSHYKEFTDGFVMVKYVLLYPSSLESTSKHLSDPEVMRASGKESLNSECNVEHQEANRSFSSSSENEENVNEGKKVKKKTARQNNKKSRHFQPSARNPAVCYIFTTEKSEGPLNIEKCLEHGVPPGPLLGDLKSGKDITLPNGRIVKSKDVKAEDLPGVKFLVLECPSEEYLDSLLNEPIFYKYQSEVDVAEAVIHFTSSRVVKTSKYQDWIKRFPQETKHLFINEDNKMTGSVAIHRMQFKLRLLGIDLFPQLYDAEIPDSPKKDNTIMDEGHSLVCESNKNEQIYSDCLFYKCDTNNFISGETMCALYLKPKMAYDYSKCLVLKKDEFLKEVYEFDGKDKIDKSREMLQNLSSKLKLDDRIYPKVVFLGTGSGKPSKVRNASGILIFSEEDKCILFDCGESTYSQLIHLYGREKTEGILRNLTAIFISHLHVDHHFGLITILKERKCAFDKLNRTVAEESNSQKTSSDFQPVYLFAPLQLLRWLQLYDEEFENISDLYELVGNSLLNEGNKIAQNLADRCTKKLNLKSISTVPVCHAPHSFGVAVVHENGWKVTYSGDTRPCEDLVNLGMDSDILIHEATFENTFKSQAKFKLHSTTSEAIDVGKRMRAKYILLTHFSQRYSYLPNIENEFSKLNIGIAFDFMEIPFNMLPLLRELITPLQYIFSEHDEKNKSAVQAFHLKKERERKAHNSYDHSQVEGVKPAKIPKRALKN